jgi:hypothetical protein
MTLKTGQQFTTGEMRFRRRPLTDFSSSPFPTPLEAGRNYTSSYIHRAGHQQPRIWTETSSEIKNMRALYVYRPGRERERALYIRRVVFITNGDWIHAGDWAVCVALGCGE